MQVKAKKLDDYLSKNGLTSAVEKIFLHDALVYKSLFSMSGQESSALIVLDDSVYNVITALVMTLHDYKKRRDVLQLINHHNAMYNHIIFVLEGNDIVLRTCYIADQESYRPALAMQLVVNLMEAAERVYPEFMNIIWSQGGR